MLGIFALIIRRESMMFAISLKPKMIIMLTIGMMWLAATSLFLTMSPWNTWEIFGIVLLWIIYSTWVLVPIVILRDIISLRYKIPVLGMSIITILRLGLGIYQGTTIKITPLSISSNQINKNYKIIFISDMHIEAVHNSLYVQSIINHIKKLQPDIVIIGGDLMNTAKLKYVNAFLPFNQLTMPIYATVGNHDHMGNSGAIQQIFEKTKIIPLRNQSISVDGIQIVGIDDKSYRGNKKLPDILKESNMSDSGQFTILVSHEPENLKKLTGFPINLELAGHTHNGQFIPMNWIIRLFNDYSYGEYHLNTMTAFVSQGIGSWWAPIRIGTQSEIVLISLEAPATK